MLDALRLTPALRDWTNWKPPALLMFDPTISTLPAALTLRVPVVLTLTLENCTAPVPAVRSIFSGAVLVVPLVKLVPFVPEKMMERSADSVSVLGPFDKFVIWIAELLELNVMSPAPPLPLLVLSATLLVNKAVLMSKSDTTETEPLTASEPLTAVVLWVTMMSPGSSSQFPVAPLSARVSTRAPSTASKRCPDVSTSPPFPP